MTTPNRTVFRRHAISLDDSRFEETPHQCTDSTDPAVDRRPAVTERQTASIIGACPPLFLVKSVHAKHRESGRTTSECRLHPTIMVTFSFLTGQWFQAQEACSGLPLPP